eukprot:8135535-Alexandrium_andersonii.AAC.1
MADWADRENISKTLARRAHFRAVPPASNEQLQKSRVGEVHWTSYSDLRAPEPTHGHMGRPKN